MTKEELIRNLKYTMEKHKNDKVDTFGTNISLMCKDILDYLEQPTTKDCLAVDCVSRAEVLNLVRLNAFHVKSQIKAIENMPPATPTRKVGEWCKQNDDYFDWYECSECGYGSEGEMQYSSEYDVRTKYCPNCGAEMRTGY